MRFLTANSFEAAGKIVRASEAAKVSAQLFVLVVIVGPFVCAAFTNSSVGKKRVGLTSLPHVSPGWWFLKRNALAQSWTQYCRCVRLKIVSARKIFSP